MSNQEHCQKIAGYWMEKAEESLESARLEYSQGHFGFCINRLYYAAFYAVSAVLAARGLKYGKHAAVRASLHREKEIEKVGEFLYAFCCILKQKRT
jgi:uncharacterized protein (UPF0332 family)